MHLNRRAFLQNSSFCLAGLGGGLVLAAEGGAVPQISVGLVTDIHYADKAPTRTRFYREALGKLDEAVDCFNREQPTLVVELGDLIDQADSVDKELEWLDTVEGRYKSLTMPRHYVLGNHCVGTLTKAEFAAHTGAAAEGHSAFERGGIHWILLDACFREDGTAYQRGNFDWKDANVPQSQLTWLEAELKRSDRPVIILAHQRLDGDDTHCVRNAAAVRSLLERSKRVVAVFQGHSHKNDYRQIGGIHYTTLVAMVEGSGLEQSGYTLLDVFPDTSLRLRGFRRQAQLNLSAS